MHKRKAKQRKTQQNKNKFHLPKKPQTKEAKLTRSPHHLTPKLQKQKVKRRNQEILGESTPYNEIYPSERRETWEGCSII